MSMSSKDLAKLLGVSPSAVSLARNHKKGVSEATRQKILRAAEEYGVPFEKAAPSSGGFLNLVIFKSHGMVFGDTPFFSELLEGVSESAAAHGFRLQVSYFYKKQDFAEQLKTLRMSGCDGVILLATEATQQDIAAFSALNRPLVVLDSACDNEAFDTVSINNEAGAFHATAHLINCGHRSLAHIASRVAIANFAERQMGFVRAIERSGHANEISSCIIPVGSTQETAYRDMSQFLDTRKTLPTAMFADNDLIALACIRAMKDHQIRVPDDVSVVGFDNMSFDYLASHRLTTIDVPKRFMGKCAVERLIARMEDSSQPHTLSILVNTRLITRNTVRCI